MSPGSVSGSGSKTIWVLEQSVFLDRFISHGGRPLPGSRRQSTRTSNLVPGFRGSHSTRHGSTGVDVRENGEDLHGTRELLPISNLEEIGVLYWHLDPKKSAKKEDTVTWILLRYALINWKIIYEEKVKSFFRERMHADEEMSYCLEGSGYFDVRDKDDNWIRIWIKEGDMIVLPAGIYHRFTVDNTNYVKLMRLFIGEPVWTAYNRPQEDHPVRQEYVKSLMGNTGFALAAH